MQIPAFQLICVIIPTYNRSHTIAEAIDSVLHQSFPHVSILVVDDGSTDETEAVLARYEKRIFTLKQNRGGPGNARNAGLEIALNRCRYIAFLDSDDMWDESKLEMQYQVMEAMPEIGFLFSDFRIVKTNGDVVPFGLKTWNQAVRDWETLYPEKRMFSSLVDGSHPVVNDFPVYSGNIYEWLLCDPYVLPSSAVIRQDCIRSGPRFPEGIFLYEDWEFFARLARNHPAGFMDVETTVNRGHDDEVRLTRCSPIEAAESRLSLVKRVWRSDTEFMLSGSVKVRSIEGNQLLIAAKEHLLMNQASEARKTLRKWRRLNLHHMQMYAFCLTVAAHLPWGSKLALFLRKLLRFFKQHQPTPAPIQ